MLIFFPRCFKHLYLEGNEISIVPGTLFSGLPNLVWLDLRNNQLAELPPEIGQHRYALMFLCENLQSRNRLAEEQMIGGLLFVMH